MHCFNRISSWAQNPMNKMLLFDHARVELDLIGHVAGTLSSRSAAQFGHAASAALQVQSLVRYFLPNHAAMDEHNRPEQRCRQVHVALHKGHCVECLNQLAKQST
eukprot:TRINITY_DN19672_c0_g1_i1.p1 TRINITY_DN19672_c0_g1~~TRINITY_DN19672_c0_g1_i1.p1  ORF type:complete len:105 (-),score=13.63 TRINITY_DN19672_c0_g1_i1:32-346(-)